MSKSRARLINNKVLVTGDSNLVTQNEILLQQSGKDIKLVERVNGKLITISKGDNNSGEEPDGEDPETSGIQKYGCLLVTPYIAIDNYGYSPSYDTNSEGRNDYDKYLIPIAHSVDIYGALSDSATIPANLLKTSTSIPTSDEDLTSMPTESPVSGYLIGLSLFKDKEQFYYINSLHAEPEGSFIDKYVKGSGNCIYKSTEGTYRFISKPNMISIPESVTDPRFSIVAYSYPCKEYYLGEGVYVNVSDELAGNIDVGIKL